MKINQGQELLFPVLFSSLLKEEWGGESQALPTHCSHRFLYYNVQSLLGVIFDLVGIIFFLTDCSNFLLLFTQGYGEVSLSMHRVLSSQFLCTQYTELAGCESEL